MREGDERRTKAGDIFNGGRKIKKRVAEYENVGGGLFIMEIEEIESIECDPGSIYLHVTISHLD